MRSAGGVAKFGKATDGAVAEPSPTAYWARSQTPAIGGALSLDRADVHDQLATVRTIAS
jgi:hypothetical protein